MKRLAALLLLVLGIWACAGSQASARPWGYYGYGYRPYYRAYYGPRPLVYGPPVYRAYYPPRVAVVPGPVPAPYYYGGYPPYYAAPAPFYPW